MKDEDQKPWLRPKRSGGVIGTSEERQLLAGTIPGGFQTRITTMPDGRTVIAKTKGFNRTEVVITEPTDLKKYYWGFSYGSGYPAYDVSTAQTIYPSNRARPIIPYSGTTTFKKHTSVDGILDLWSLTGTKLSFSTTARTQPASTNGVAASVMAWSEEDDGLLIDIPCEGLGAVRAFGNPWHGEIYDDLIHTAEGDVPLPGWFEVATPSTQLVAFAGAPEIDTALALDWKNYAILSGQEKWYMPTHSLPIGETEFIYRAPNTSLAYKIYVDYDNDPGPSLGDAGSYHINVWARTIETKYTTLGRKLVETTVAFSAGTFNADRGARRFIYQSPDGTKAVVSMSRSAFSGYVGPAGYDPRHYLWMSQAFEVVVDMGNDPDIDPIRSRATRLFGPSPDSETAVYGHRRPFSSMLPTYQTHFGITNYTYGAGRTLGECLSSAYPFTGLNPRSNGLPFRSQQHYVAYNNASELQLVESVLFADPFEVDLQPDAHTVACILRNGVPVFVYRYSNSSQAELVMASNNLLALVVGSVIVGLVSPQSVISTGIPMATAGMLYMGALQQFVNGVSGSTYLEVSPPWISWNPATDALAIGPGHTWI